MNAVHAVHALTLPWAITDAGFEAARNEVTAAQASRSFDSDDLDAYSTPHRLESGIGVLPIRGTLWERGWWCFSGYNMLRQALSELLEWPLLKAIVLPIDSPGGVCAGLLDFCLALRAARARVPVYAVIDREACSAACVIACQAQIVLASADGIAGSLGTKMAHWDESARLAKDGTAVRHFYRGRYKLAGDSLTPTSQETVETYEMLADRTYSQLLEMVSSGRPSLTPEMVVATEARIYYGADIVAAGLADDVGTYDELITLLEGEKETNETRD